MAERDGNAVGGCNRRRSRLWCRVGSREHRPVTRRRMYREGEVSTMKESSSLRMGRTALRTLEGFSPPPVDPPGTLIQMVCVVDPFIESLLETAEPEQHDRARQVVEAAERQHDPKGRHRGQDRRPRGPGGPCVDPQGRRRKGSARTFSSWGSEGLAGVEGFPSRKYRAERGGARPLPGAGGAGAARQPPPRRPGYGRIDARPPSSRPAGRAAPAAGHAHHGCCA